MPSWLETGEVKNNEVEARFSSPYLDLELKGFCLLLYFLRGLLGPQQAWDDFLPETALASTLVSRTVLLLTKLG